MDEHSLGIPAASTHALSQSHAWAELVNKLSWAIGSTYRVPYRNPRTGARLTALSMAQVLLQDHGYPAHLVKD